MKPGTIVWVDFDPTVGHEQRGRRPALVISAPFRSMSIVVPLTSTPPSQPFHHRMTGERMSTALCDQVRSIDARRVVGIAGEATAADLAAVRRIVKAMIS